MYQTEAKGTIFLLITALIWGSAFVAQSMGMDYVGPLPSVPPVTSSPSSSSFRSSSYLPKKETTDPTHPYGSSSNPTPSPLSAAPGAALP